MNALITSTQTGIVFEVGPFATAADITAFASTETPDPATIPADPDLETAGALPISSFTVTQAPA